MQQITQALTTWSSVRKAPTVAENPRTEALISLVFERLKQMIGRAEMGRVFEGEPPELVQKTWARYLDGFSDEEIERGMQHVARVRFMPRLGEFAIACRPCLEPEYAWHEAAKCLRQRDAGKVGDWTHPAVWRAACALSMEVRSGDYLRHRGRWACVMADELAEGWGSGVPAPVLRLETEPLPTKGPTAEQRAALDALRGKFRRPTETEANGEI